MQRLLLISSSTVHGIGYLEHAAAEIRDLLGPHRRHVLFVPYALHDLDAYEAKAAGAFAALGHDLTSIHRHGAAAAAADVVARAEALFVGGGNTFRLLCRLYEHELLEPIRRRVGAGVPYIGTSAGSNVAGATVRTTNDMPIVEPPSFAALGLVSFQINPHYVDPDPSSTHMGETREQRLREYLEENDNPVIALREGAMLRVDGARVVLRGTRGGRLFRRVHPPLEVEPGAEIGTLLQRDANNR